MEKIKLLIVCNVDWFFISHRLGIAKKAVEDGFDVYVAAEDTGRSNEIKATGAKFINLRFSRSGTNAIDEIKVLWKFRNLYKTLKPYIVHHITLKPVIYGSLIARLQNIKGVVNAIAGLGYNFTNEKKGVLFKVLIKMMKFGFNRKNLAVIFQNDSDFEDLYKAKVLSPHNSIFYTKGSGVDLKQYAYTNLPANEKVTILFPTRMLWEKGVQELKEASDLLKKKYQDKIRFVLAGLADDGNISGVSSEYLREWSDGDYVNWVGYYKNMPELFSKSDIVTLPSYYREGIPKSLIEACAIGRPIITTNSIGCKECVDEGRNGFKVEPKDSIGLANALEKLILSKKVREEFSTNSRIKAEKEFDVNTVIDIHMEIYKKLSI